MIFECHSILFLFFPDKEILMNSSSIWKDCRVFITYQGTGKKTYRLHFLIVYSSHSCMIVDNVITQQKQNLTQHFLWPLLKNTLQALACYFMIFVDCVQINNKSEKLSLNYFWQIFLHVVIFKLRVHTLLEIVI